MTQIETEALKNSDIVANDTEKLIKWFNTLPARYRLFKWRGAFAARMVEMNYCSLTVGFDIATELTYANPCLVTRHPADVANEYMEANSDE